MGEALITRRGSGAGAAGSLPEFTYSGTYQLIDDGKTGATQNWRLKLLTSGTLTFSKVVQACDVFLVGGGAGGAHGGGGGGYTTTSLCSPVKETAYSVVVGAGGGLGTNGGASIAFGVTANGGYRNSPGGGNGGSGGGGFGGGAGGSDGGNGGAGLRSAGIGQGTTTREFGEADGELYAGGGGTGNGNGGAGGGGGYQVSGTVNTGGGGGGGAGDDSASGAGNGGSGIVVIRNHRG